MSNRATLQVMPNAISSLESGSGLTHYDVLGGMTIVQFGQHLAPANLSARQAKNLGYAFGAVPFPAASVGAPHIRDRLYWVGHNNDQGLEGFRIGYQAESGRHGAVRSITTPGEFGGLATHTNVPEHYEWASVRGQSLHEQRSELIARQPPSGPTNGFWADTDWLFCRDGKWRPVEPGTFPLAHGITQRMVQLRAYGNAIVAPQAEIFIECCREYMDLDN